MVMNRALIEAMSETGTRCQRSNNSSYQPCNDEDAEQHARCDSNGNAEDPCSIADPGDSDYVGDRMEPNTPRTLGSSGGISRHCRVAGLAVSLVAAAASAAAVLTAARGAHAHSGDGALEAEGRLNMRAFSGRMSAAALPALRKAAGLAKPTDDDLEHAEALAFLSAAEAKLLDKAPELRRTTPATSAAVLDAQRTLDVFTMKSSMEGGSDSFLGCIPVRAACGEGARCCEGSMCNKKNGGHCVLRLQAAVPQDLVNGSSNNASSKEETVEKVGAAKAGSSNNASLKDETVEKGGAAKAAAAETTPETSAAKALPCAESEQSCLETGCCAHPGHTCYRQNEWWAGCNATCSNTSSWDPYSSQWVRVETGGGWDCTPLTVPSPRGPEPGGPEGCASSGEQCASSRCCSDSGLRCFRKDQYWASCNATCNPGRKWDQRSWTWVDSDKNEWDCEELAPNGGVAAGEKPNGSVAAEEKPKSPTSTLPKDQDAVIYMKRD